MFTKHQLDPVGQWYCLFYILPHFMSTRSLNYSDNPLPGGFFSFFFSKVSLCFLFISSISLLRFYLFICFKCVCPYFAERI